MALQLNEDFWTEQYHKNETGWDIGFASTPIIEYVDQLNNKELKILIPGAGNSYEAEYLHESGFKNIFVLDLSAAPLVNLQARVPDFPSKNLIHQNFFHHNDQYDLIIEQTFFCALNPSLREQYGQQMHKLLKKGGKIAGLWFNFANRPMNQGPPFNGTKEEYLAYFKGFDSVKFENCYNSIEPRQGNELFGIIRK